MTQALAGNKLDLTYTTNDVALVGSITNDLELEYKLDRDFLPYSWFEI